MVVFILSIMASIKALLLSIFAIRVTKRKAKVSSWQRATVIIYILQQKFPQSYKMQTSNVSTKRNQDHSGPAPRVPIPLSIKEESELMALAGAEYRSKSAMARIIYLTGLKHYKQQG
jgi:hypothetical protein